LKPPPKKLGFRAGRRGSWGAGVVRAMEGLRDVEGVAKAQYDGATVKVGGPTSVTSAGVLFSRPRRDLGLDFMR
jgi:hypothetical protein